MRKNSNIIVYDGVSTKEQFAGIIQAFENERLLPRKIEINFQPDFDFFTESLDKEMKRQNIISHK